MLKHFLLRYQFVLLLFLPLSIVAQDNSIYVTGGALVLVNSLNFNYEHKVSESETNQGLYVKSTIGQLWTATLFGDGDDDSNNNLYLSAGGVYLLGHNASSFGMGLGIGHFSRSDFSRAVPVANVGYRYMGKRSIFRTGIGFLEGLYLSYGYRF